MSKKCFDTSLNKIAQKNIYIYIIQYIKKIDITLEIL